MIEFETSSMKDMIRKSRENALCYQRIFRHPFDGLIQLFKGTILFFVLMLIGLHLSDESVIGCSLGVLLL